MAVSRGRGWSRPVRLLPLLVRCLGVLSAVPLGMAVWHGPGLKRLGPAALSADPVAGRVVLVLAASVYLFYWTRVWPRTPRLLVGSLVVAMALLAAAGHDLTRGVGDDLWIYAAVIAGCGLPPRVSLPVIGLLAALLLVPPGPAGVVMGASTVQVNLGGPLRAGTHASPLTPALSLIAMAARALPLIVIGCAVTVLTFLARTNAELHTAQTQLARLAVEEERARLSRDLHDLLGHNLSLMALKAELAARLLDQPEHPATEEVQHLKLMARSALGDLREVVAGGRLPTLAGELDGARIAARAAAIDLLVEDERTGVLAPEVEAVCAWIVREGMTNVVKHSGARRCRLRIEQHSRTLVVVVADDGRGGSTGDRGSGLKGLGERIAALSGELHVRPRGGVLGGFELAARVPGGAGEAAS